jgi:ribonuclease R
MSKKHRKGPESSSAGDEALLSKKVLDTFTKMPNRTMNYKQVAAKMGLKPTKVRGGIEYAFKKLVAEGQLIAVDHGRYKLKYHELYTTGRVDMTNSGNAYVISPDTEEDIIIKAGNLNRALHGDEVKVLLFARTKGRRLEGEVVEIVKRKKMEFVGTVQVNKNFAFLVPDDRKMVIDIFIPIDQLNGAENGQKAVAKITDWPDRGSSPVGEITRVLGNAGEHQTEIHAILAQYGLPYEFPEEVENEAQSLSLDITDADRKGRRDFREITTFTIDPADAKDFDDALSMQKLPNGNWEIGVHIADVTHYLQSGTVLDEEAIARATSVYLVDRVVPMLPEVLSNNVCSLRPKEEKLTFSAVFEMDEHAHVITRWFGRTLIYSDRRYSYEEAQEILEGKPGDFENELRTMNKLAKILRDKRMKNGAISFDKREVKFTLDENQNPTGVYFKTAKEANHLIEEFMLLANRSVAEFIGQADDKSATGKTFVYRVHDDPDPTKLMDLSGFVKQFGFKINVHGRKAISASLNKMLSEVKDTPEANMIETLAVRSMAKAVYTTKNIGHYGLAFDYYTHFTSPIRRYPDVLVHRLLQHYLDKGQTPAANTYEELCEHCSDREKLASQAERDSIKYMQVKFMEQYVGEEFTGVITGVTDWGIYVELLDNHCEGMIKIRDFTDDYYMFDEKNYCIFGERTGKIYQLGDTLRIRVKAADLEKKQLDFEPVDTRKRKVTV